MKQQNQKRKLVVVGDVWVDNVLLPVSKQMGDHLEMFALPGGALLIRDMMAAWPDRHESIEIVSYRQGELETLSKEEIIHLLAEGHKVSAKSDDGGAVYIKKFMGYSGSGPENGVPALARDFTYESSDREEVIVIDDAGKGFRNVESAWEHVIEKAEKNKKAMIVYNMAGPLFTGKLWQRISRGGALTRTIVIVDANDLRQEGVHISRKLSWDRTIADFATILAYSEYDDMEKCPHILVRFGLEGVIYYYRQSKDGEAGKRDVRVFYVPNRGEGETVEGFPGTMNGLTSAFSGQLALELAKVEHPVSALTEVIPQTVSAVVEGVIRLLESGYRQQNGGLQYPLAVAWSGDSPGRVKTLDLHTLDPAYFESVRQQWSILSRQIPLDYHLKDIAMEYVVSGTVDALDNVPVVRFGKLLTVDKNEIENFRSIKNLIREYLENSTANKPLSIAVFGPPGSGKSFAVKNVANAVFGEKAGGKVDVLEYNLSQFGSPQDIVRAFHEIRDYALRGSTPLVFFDEFDSSYQSESLGWLKYFLAPMQDGIFKEGEKTHPLGRAILVFAGGTHRSLKAFAREGDTGTSKPAEDFLAFAAAKGPDFISRLNGYVDILGPNPIDRGDGQDTAPYRDRFFIIRRAVLLRALLLQQQDIVDENKRIRIDADVLRALLLIPRYKHGARSMSAIINMSMLAGRNRFEKASLPSLQQLWLHLDADVFINTLDRDLIINIASLDRAIHQLYCDSQRAMDDWDHLDEETKKLNRMLAKNIPFYLLLINCSYRPRGEQAKQQESLDIFTHEEIDYMARMAHERWVHEKRSKGWAYGPQKDDEKRLHPCIVPWQQLPDDLKTTDRNTMKNIPQILANVGFEIYRL